jgi:DNA-binding Lrp family transcriptional regulator
MPSAFMLVNCETDSTELFTEELKKMSGIEFVVRVSGVYEFFVKINSATDEELKKVVTEIRTNNWVRSSSTLMIAKSWIFRSS